MVVLLCILDGWGLAPSGPANAVSLADTPVMDGIWARWPHTQLAASGSAVGLPDGQMGNSEVGHTNLGAGRVVWQSLTRIDRSITDGTFFANPALLAACASARGARLHLFGLCSDGGIHSTLAHLLALLELARLQGVADVVVHAVTDGRDTAPDSARRFLQTIGAEMERTGVGRFGSVMGRYYAMDRDRRWARTALAYDALVGRGPTAPDWVSALAAAASRRAPNGQDPETDEFLLPAALPGGAIRAGDSVIAFNWRADRMRQITAALTDPAFDAFARPMAALAHFVGMCPYDPAWSLPAAFEGEQVSEGLGEVCSRAGLRQLRLAESEKYAHVTYFFNGGREAPFPGEDRILVPSPRVPTYDLQPEMSAKEVAAAGVRTIAAGDHALAIVNFANPDMVGHTGDLKAAIAACAAADRGLGQLLEALAAHDGCALVLADHGNAEVMVDPRTGRPHTAHTTNPVPAVLVGRPDLTLRAGGCLGDVAPTLLDLLGLPAPEAMTAKSLIVQEGARHAADR